MIIISKGEITGDVRLKDGRAVSSQRDTANVPGTALTLSLEIAGAPADNILSVLTDIQNVIQVERTDSSTDDVAAFKLHYTPTTDIRAVVAETVVGRGWRLLEMHTTEVSLEELFLSLTV